MSSWHHLPRISPVVLGPQLYLGYELPVPARFRPPTIEPDSLRVKPFGGLWTSTLTSGPNRDEPWSDWLDWCKAEEFGSWQDKHRYRLVPDPRAIVLNIDTLNDLMMILRQYSQKEEEIRFPDLFAPIDFEGLARDGIDGIHLTDSGQWATRHSSPGLYGWDCESTLFLRWVFPLPAVKLRVR